MHRLFKTLILLPWLSACAPSSWSPGGGTADWNSGPSAGSLAGPLAGRLAGRPAGQRAGATHDFNWRLSGDRQVAPLQVFDDGARTWLQFAPGQPVPALFTEQNGLEQPARYVTQAPYVVVQGKWPAVVMRGGALQARADYLGAALDAAAMSAAPSAAMSSSMAMAASSPAARGAANGGFRSPHTADASASMSPSPRAPVPARGNPGHGATTSSPAGLYRVGPADENMRRALARWAGLAGWTFQAEHWAVDVDIPLAGSADFSDDFKRSVRELVAATELGDRPLQPCFYANQVLRVIPLSQACDRTALRPGTAI
ncbi:Toxin co-regulated pilus biosynthesis protein Q C-terminal domain-containing protein [Bordetella sputigena]|uniref:TcpQ domain-containing protein n=1 Tax=Bordetella sputigena TaxID=1416810 RepID=UPI0039EFD151